MACSFRATPSATAFIGTRPCSQHRLSWSQTAAPCNKHIPWCMYKGAGSHLTTIRVPRRPPQHTQIHTPRERCNTQAVLAACAAYTCRLGRLNTAWTSNKAHTALILCVYARGTQGKQQASGTQQRAAGPRPAPWCTTKQGEQPVAVPVSARFHLTLRCVLLGQQKKAAGSGALACKKPRQLQEAPLSVCPQTGPTDKQTETV